MRRLAFFTITIAFTMAAPTKAGVASLALIDTPIPNTDNSAHQALITEAEDTPDCQMTNHGERMHTLAASVVPPDTITIYPVTPCTPIPAEAVAAAIGEAARDGAEVIAVPLRVDLGALWANYPTEMRGADDVPLVAAFSLGDASRYAAIPESHDGWGYAVGAMTGINPDQYAPTPVQAVDVPRRVKTENTRFAYTAGPSAAAVVGAARMAKD